MPTRSIQLTEHYDQIVQDQIAAGRYKDASEVLRAGLRLLEQKAREDEEKLAVLRGLAAEGFEALDRGQGMTLEGERQLADCLAKIGHRASQGVASSPCPHDE